MGGFHGGHSGGGGSGGGFHGGHSGGGHSRPMHHGHPIYHGHVYYGADYGESNGKPMTFGGVITMAVIMIVIGVVLFFAILRVPCNAFITSTSRGYDGSYYEKYEFTYEMYGETYTGNGDDDLKYMGYNVSTGEKIYEETVKVGEVYKVYVHLYNPSGYSFESDNVACVIGVILVVIGIVSIVTAVIKKKNFNERLKTIGDVNGDGKLDENDIEASEEGLNSFTVDTDSEATIQCPYCDSFVNASEQYCKNCGAKLR